MYVLRRRRSESVRKSPFNLRAQNFSPPGPGRATSLLHLESDEEQNLPSCGSTWRAVLLTPDAGRTTSLSCARAPTRTPQPAHPCSVRAHAPPPPPSRLPAGRGRSHGESHGEALCSAIVPAGSTHCCGSTTPPKRGRGEGTLCCGCRGQLPRSPPPSPLPLPSRVSTILQAGQGVPVGRGGAGARCPSGQTSDGPRRHLRALTRPCAQCR